MQQLRRMSFPRVHNLFSAPKFDNKPKKSSFSAAQKISSHIILFISIHLLIIMLIFPTNDVFPPFTVIQIPLNGLFNTISKFSFW